MDKGKIDELINLTFALTGQAQAYQVDKATIEDLNEQRERLINLCIAYEAQAEGKGYSLGYAEGLRDAREIVKGYYDSFDKPPSKEDRLLRGMISIIQEAIDQKIKECK